MFLLYFTPYCDKWKQATVIFNEICLLGLNYYLFLFTDFVNQNQYLGIGNAVIITVIAIMGINVSI